MNAPFYYLKVTGDAELDDFRQNYLVLAGNDLDISYLKKAIVYQFYVGPRAVAGFVLNTANMNPLRYFSYLEDDLCQKVLEDENLRKTEFLEITANYKHPKLTRRQSRIYYKVMLSKAYRHALRLRKSYLLGGSVIKPIKLIQQELLNRTIYNGPISPAKQQLVKGGAVVLKIYIVEVAHVPFRAFLVISNRYFVRGLKNTVKRWMNRFVRLVRVGQ